MREDRIENAHLFRKGLPVGVPYPYPRTAVPASSWTPNSSTPHTIVYEFSRIGAWWLLCDFGETIPADNLADVWAITITRTDAEETTEILAQYRWVRRRYWRPRLYAWKRFAAADEDIGGGIIRRHAETEEVTWTLELSSTQTSGLARTVDQNGPYHVSSSYGPLLCHALQRPKPLRSKYMEDNDSSFSWAGTPYDLPAHELLEDPVHIDPTSSVGATRRSPLHAFVHVRHGDTIAITVRGYRVDLSVQPGLTDTIPDDGVPAADEIPANLGAANPLTIWTFPILLDETDT